MKTLKNLAMKNYLALLGLWMLIYMIACSPNGSEDKKDVKKDTNERAVEAFRSGHLLPNELKIMKCYVKDSITDINGKKLHFAESYFSFGALLAYYNQPTTIGINALRFYPAMDEFNHVQLIMTRTVLDFQNARKTQNDLDPVLLNNAGCYPGNFDLGDLLSPEDANHKIQDFFANTRLKGELNTEENSSYKRSRLYEFSDILDLMRGNIPNFDASDLSQYVNYKLAIHIGYTNLGMTDTLYARVPPAKRKYFSSEELVGFSVIIVLHDENDNALLNSVVYNNADSIYFRKALEIAHVCPPVCGDLY